MKRFLCGVLCLFLIAALLLPLTAHAGTIPGADEGSSGTSSGSSSHSSSTTHSSSGSSGSDSSSIGKTHTDGTAQGPIKGWIYDPWCGPCQVDLGAYFEINLLTDTTVYTPKITMIHNMNAMCAESNAGGDVENDPVYYIPTTEDLPFDIKKYVQSNTETGDKRHSFSYVYDGFFDAEANLNNGGIQSVKDSTGENAENGTGQKYTARVSKSIDTRRIAHPALKTIGYDLLLSSETYNVWKDSKGDIRFTNKSTSVIAEQAEASNGKDSPNGKAKKINYQTAVMDIYKALGQYEYYITMAFTQDKMWETNESPILSELSVATSAQKTDGMDITESYCGMAVTRTKPSLYMDKLYKDGITTRGMEDTSNPSEILHSGSDLPHKQAITFGEFCHLLVPLMNLYGEETISEETLSHAAQCYSQEMACIDNLSAEDKQIIVWMLAKGLIDGEQLSRVKWDSPIVLLDSDVVSGEEGNYIIDILGRVADPNRRVKYSLPESMDAELASQGFGEVNVSVSNETYNVSERPNSTFDVYDYFIEFNLSTCYRLLEKTTGAKSSGKRVDAEYDQAVNNALNSKSKDADEEVNDEYDYDEAFEDIDAVKTISTSYIRLFNLNADTKAINMSEYNFYDNISARSNQYHYYGVEQIGDKRYYHFKVNKKLAAAGFKIGFEVPKKVLNKTNVAYSKPISINSGFITLSSGNVHNGGVFDYNTDELPKEQQDELAPVNKESKHQTISELELDDIYTDATSKTTFARPVADSFTSIIFYKELKKFDNLENDTVFHWEDLIGADRTLRIGERVSIASKPNDTYIYIHPYTGKPKKDECLRVEIQTKVPDLVKACKFFKDNKDSHESLGYYRYSDKEGTSDLLVSFSYLKDNNVVTSITNSDDKKTWIISAGEFQNNVILHADDEEPYIIVGETLIKVPAKTVLVHTVNGEYYINYRACLGWAKEFALVDTSDINHNGKQLSVMAVPFTEAAIGTNEWSQELTTVQLPYSGGHPLNITTNYIKFNKKKVEFSGIPLTASYALSPYMLVMDMTQPKGGADYLFVWHSTHVVTTDGNEPIKDAKKIKKKHNAAIKKLNKVLPIEKAFKKNECKDYYLTYYRLSRSDNSQNPVGLNYVSSEVSTEAGNRSVTMGYWWTPPVCNRSQPGKNVQKYLDAYANSVKGGKKPECILPIIEVKVGNGTSRLMDVNVNTSAKTESSKPNKLGTLPCYYMDHTPSEVKKWAKLDADGYPKLVDSSKDTSSYVTFTAPVSLFAQLKGLGTLNLSQTSSTTVYFGTVPCEYDGAKVTINGHESSLKQDDKAICTYLGSGASTVYAITVGGTAIGKLLETLNEDIEYFMNDPSSLVDWGQFKFHRLIQNMDAWSTIVLIFILNILPRVCLLLFFALMLLSLIKDVKPWQIFCNKVFDIYSFLSFGRYTVQTIDTRQTVITSLICSAIFIVIMDGQLFNFIIWVCKFFIALYQR